MQLSLMCLISQIHHVLICWTLLYHYAWSELLYQLCLMKNTFVQDGHYSLQILIFSYDHDQHEVNFVVTLSCPTLWAKVWGINQQIKPHSFSYMQHRIKVCTCINLLMLSQNTLFFWPQPWHKGFSNSFIFLIVSLEFHFVRLIKFLPFPIYLFLPGFPNVNPH